MRGDGSDLGSRNSVVGDSDSDGFVYGAYDSEDDDVYGYADGSSGGGGGGGGRKRVVSNTKLCELAMTFMHRLCEGHNNEMQNILRDQVRKCEKM
jgi:hypothetical protein